MVKVDSKQRVNDFGIVGKLGRPYYFGQRIYGGFYYGEEEPQIPMNLYGIRLYGLVEYGTDDIRAGIYQRRHSRGKVIYTRSKFYIPSNPQTAPQQANRTKFANGMIAWGNLTQNQKNVYNQRAEKYHIHGVNLFLREWLKSN